MKVFILEDDSDQAALMQHWLEDHDHSCRVFAEGRSFIDQLPYEQPDLVILDWNLPGLNGLDILNWIRSSDYHDLPVIFATTRGHDDDLVKALDQGADDYLVKPIKKVELIARAQALHRRHNKGNTGKLVFDPYQFDTNEQTVTYLATPIKLTAKEFQLAFYFFNNPDRLISRDYLLETIWTKSASISTRTVDTHISRLRKKLDLDGSSGWKLISVYHKGYRLIKTEQGASHG
jgi:two-component system response regulator RegX3